MAVENEQLSAQNEVRMERLSRLSVTSQSQLSQTQDQSFLQLENQRLESQCSGFKKKIEALTKEIIVEGQKLKQVKM